MIIIEDMPQRWSRGHNARGQGQRHKKIPRQGQPFRGQTLSRPRTGMLDANQCQRLRTQRESNLKKKRSTLQKIRKFS